MVRILQFLTPYQAISRSFKATYSTFKNILPSGPIAITVVFNFNKMVFIESQVELVVLKKLLKAVPSINKILLLVEHVSTVTK